MLKFSVLMSIYSKENPLFFERSIRSIWYDQSVRPSEIVLVIDGPLTGKLYDVIDKWREEIGCLFKTIQLPKNVGLGRSLNSGLEYCRFGLIARMDTDDVSLPFRFEKQLSVFKRFNVDVCGSWVGEFVVNDNEIVSYRKVPEHHQEIVRYSKMRN